MSSMVLQLLPHLQKLDGLTLQADVFTTPSEVQQSLHLPENTTYNSWSISKQPAVDVEQPNFVSGLAVLFVLLYDFNLQYQEEAAPLRLRCFLNINPECASKTKKGKVTYKKTGHVVHKKNSTVNPQVWVNAAAQIFNSIGISFGSMISMASYNKFNNNILRDTFIVSLANSATSIMAGIVIFSAIGYMAHIHNLPVDDIATDGPGLVFVVYPEVFSTMPVSQLWAPLFFIMLLCLGLDSQFAMVEVAVTFIMDGFGKKVLQVFKQKELIVLAVCSVGFLLGIPHITRGGIYVFQLMDHYTAVVSLMFLAFFEVLAITLIFGVRRLSVMVENMLGKKPNLFFRVCWQFLSPMLVLGILISSIFQYTPARYGKSYTYPLWAEVVGWFISLVSIIWIPLGAVHELWTTQGSPLQRLKKSITPTLDLKSVSEKPSAPSESIALFTAA